ncbi:FHA domain containing protein [Tolypothrix sp. NIES-4075]|uniref:hypothetical protein n=1 Tax=Tolypothrix sp. NIES-4075 TaxID=2005459 RepID=UPI000B6773B1|nr:hypothetical protein [Tolypothrix sp. NIES-4075]GAX41196.1 FHA domain containing protein [Tolypothrix sp. NIES-4075]
MKWWTTAIAKIQPRIAILRRLIIFLLVLSITSCGDKAVSQEVSNGYKEKPQPISRQFSEVSPPAVIQELRSLDDIYQPQVTILTPQADEVLQDDKVTVRLQVKDLPIFKDPKFDLGPHLHVILDNQPYISVYDLNQPLVLPDLSPGTHTLRVFASRPWDESFKNEGAYAQTTFHIFTKSDDNNPDAALPLITYNRPQGIYGAEPILLDFYLTNAPLHLVAKDNPNNQIADWRIRCTINGESFVLDRWQAIYLKGFKPGKNWVKLEFLDDKGNVVKNVFNSTIRLITYEPKGKDTLSQIVRGELSAEQVRSIVDPNYTAKPTTAEPTSAPTVETTPDKVEEPVTKSESPESSQPKQVEPQPKETPTPEPTIPEQSPQTDKPKFGGFFNRRGSKLPTPQPPVTPSPSVPPTLPEIIESPTPEPKLEETKTPELIEPQLEETPKSTIPEQSAQTDKPRFGGFFNRRKFSNPSKEPQLEETETPKSTIPEQSAQQSAKWRFGGFFNRRQLPNASPSESVSPTLPEIIEPEAQLKETPTPESTTLPEKIAPNPEEPELKRYFNPRQFNNASPSPNLPLNQPEDQG